MTRLDEVILLADKLSLSETADLMNHLAERLKHALEVEAFRRMPWNEFIDRTAGSLANDPIERPQQGEFEEREPVE